jgi:hypothetical protein
MNGDDLDKAQTQAMADTLFRSINYFLRMKQRMHVTGFPPGHLGADGEGIRHGTVALPGPAEPFGVGEHAAGVLCRAAGKSLLHRPFSSVKTRP